MEGHPLHRSDRCLALRRRVAVTLPLERGAETFTVDAESVWRNLSERWREWHGMDVWTRVDSGMGLCPFGLLDPSVTPGVERGIELLARCSLSETFHVMPRGQGLDQEPNALVQAFSVIREEKTLVERRRQREAEEWNRWARDHAGGAHRGR